MVGGAVERDVDREVHPALAACVAEHGDVVDGTELGRHGEVAAVCGTDRVRAPDVARLGECRVVASFAVGGTDRMDGRDVRHVKTHLCDVVEPVDRLA